MSKKNYLDSLKSWETDRHVSSNIQRNILFILTLTSSIGLLIVLTMLRSMYERKKIEPYILEYNKRTGQVAVVKQETKQNYTQNRIVRESLIVNYIQAREGIRPVNADELTEKIRLMSSDRVYQEFVLSVKKDISEMRGFGINPRQVVTMESIKFNNSNNAEIKFTKQMLSETAEAPERTFILTIAFQFATLDLKMNERYINPLEFQVTFYDRKEETVLKKDESAINKK